MCACVCVCVRVCVCARACVCARVCVQVPATSAGITGAGHGSPQRPQQHRQQPAQGQGLDDLQAQLLASVQLSQSTTN